MKDDHLFADTSAFLALVNSNDQFHEPAVEFLSSHPQLVTSTWVIEEFIAHLHARYNLESALEGVNFIENFVNLEIIFMDKTSLQEAFQEFKKYGSRRVSLVDVGNVILMDRYDLEEIFCFDQRFKTVFEKKVFPTTDN